ncbi:MAG: hypothetical protein NTW19_18305 [Planctomycetota bacterium]|nr:hypothetical protein [Planctomycetota bacterium]
MDYLTFIADQAGAVTSILTTWLLAAGALLGLGAGARRLFGARSFSSDAAMAAYAAGLAIALAFLQLWHLLWPVDARAALALLALGGAGLAWTAPAILAWLRAAGRRSLLPLALLAIASLWLSNRALTGPTGTDASLYHLQAVRWAHTYPIVPGLANLSPRFGFNNANHLLNAAAGSGPWEHRGGHIATPLFVLGLWAVGILGMVRAWRDHPRRFQDLFDAAMLGPAFLMSVHGDIASPSSDLPAAALSLLGASMLVRLLFDAGGSSDAGGAASERRTPADAAALPMLTLVLAAAVCIKLSAAVFAGSAFLIAAGAVALASRRRVNRIVPTLALAVAAGALLVGPWALRGVIISGYPFFPASMVSVDVPWRTPRAMVDYERLSVTSWARQPARPIAPSQDWAWVRVRLREYTYADPISVLYPLLFAGATLALAAVVGRRDTEMKRAWPPTAAVLVVWAVTVAAWFLTAPALRFAWHLFFIPPALGAAALVASLNAAPSTASSPATRRRPSFSSLALAICCVALIIRVNDPLLFRPLLTPPGPDAGLTPTPVSPQTQFVTRSGLRLNVPESGGLCWDAPLPCTPYPKPGLRLRRDGDLGSGFTLEGE